MISVFGWPDSNTDFDQSEQAFYTCYFTIPVLDTGVRLQMI